MRNPRIKNEDKNVWLKGNRMKQYFPTIVKKFNSRKFGGKRVDDAQETILNPTLFSLPNAIFCNIFFIENTILFLS